MALSAIFPPVFCSMVGVVHIVTASPTLLSFSMWFLYTLLYRSYEISPQFFSFCYLVPEYLFETYF